MSDVTDATVVLMPALSPNMAEGRLVRWFVREGQAVEPGDLLAEVAFGNSTVEIEAKGRGRVAALLFAAGVDGIKAEAAIARIEETERQVSTPGVVEVVETVVPSAAPSHAVHANPHAIDAALAGPVATLTYREALRDALSNAMARDARVVVIGEDVAQNRGAQRVTQGLLDAYGEERVITLRPADEAAFAMALGAAVGGLRPVVEVSSWGASLSAMTGALETAAVWSSLASERSGAVPLVVRGPHGWTSGAAGLGAQNVAVRLAAIPGLKVLAPSTPVAAKLLLEAAIADGGPVAVLETEDLYETEGPVPSHGEVAGIVIGRAHVARVGHELTLVSYGRLVPRSLRIAEDFAAKGHEIEVIDLLSLNPLDTDTVKASLAKTRRLLIVEEGPQRFGIGAQLLAELAIDAKIALDAPPVRLSGWEGASPYSSAFEASILPSDDRITAAISGLLG